MGLDQAVGSGAKKPCVFIQTNHKQIVGAIVSEHSFRRFSRHNDEFDVRIMRIEDFPFFAEKEGETFLRGGKERTWMNDDLQSFTPTRFLPPQLMGFEGRAVVVDPDVFALEDVWTLFTMDMQGKAIWCRQRSKKDRDINGDMATSVMLLDCAKLRHWDVERQFRSMFDGDLDYKDWVPLRLEPRESIGLLDNVWNDLDVLTRRTRFLHTTKRITQPWKTGLPVDFRPADKASVPVLGWANSMRRKLFGEYALLGRYRRNPDKNQENLFFALLRECVEEGKVTIEQLHEEMAKNHVRHDALEIMENAPPLENVLEALPA